MVAAYSVFLQWMLLRRVFAGHTPLRLMALGNLAVGLGGFYFMTIVIGQGSARTHGVYAAYGGAPSFMAVGVAMNQLLTVGLTAIAHAVVDERNQGNLGYWATTGRRLAPLVLSASMGQFVLACVNAVATFVLLVLLFPVHFDIQPLTFRGAPVTDPTFLSQWLPWAAFALVAGPLGVYVFELGLRRAFRSGKFVQT